MPHNKKSRHIKRIAVIGTPILQARSDFNAALIAYAEKKGDWQFVMSLEASVKAFQFLRDQECDGAIVRILSPLMAAEARRVAIPMVNFSSWLADPKVPTVRPDNIDMSRVCAEHLLSKGFRRFGVVVTKGGWYPQPRYETFLRTVKAAGFGANVSTFELNSHPVSDLDLRRFRMWIMKLQPPVGLFLTDDEDAVALMQACQDAGRRIPTEVAVIATYGHPHIVHACHPPLSYADQNDELVALRAAEYLDELMSGQTREVRTIELPSRGVVALGSTDTMALEDREAARAVEYIRAHISEPINIKDVAQQFSIARRTLERRFRTTMGISLHDFLVKERLERAKDLLRSTLDLKLEEVARRSGFANAHRLNLVFRQGTGVSASEWRRQAVAK